MAPIRLDVASERGGYPVWIGAGLAGALPRLLAEQAIDRQVLPVSSAPVWRLHGRRVKWPRGAGAPVLIPDGERAKTLASVGRIYDALITGRFDRSATVVAVGGGVVGDVAGFAAATYLRGVRFAQVPTTLLAQVDSAIGGKVGVNLPAGKNLIGAFHAPALVVCDPDLLATLPRREFRAGLYEVVKYGVIASRALFDRVGAALPDLMAMDSAALADAIADCCRIKAAIVGADERETGPRRVLNFGHTIGHALEAVTRYRRFRHGEAIAWGMLAAARISSARGMMPAPDHAALQDLIARLGPLPAVADLRVADALAAVTHDKKVAGRRLHYVLCRGLGETAIADDVHPQELAEAMRGLGMRG